MRPKLLLRIAAGCLLFFAVGHSIGHVTRHQVTDAKAKEVLQMMADNKFDLFGQMRSYDEMFTGMSLNLTLTLLAFIAIQWTISTIADTNKKLAIKLLIPLSLCVFGFSVTGFLFFFPVPAVTCLATVILNTIAGIQLNRKIG